LNDIELEQRYNIEQFGLEDVIKFDIVKKYYNKVIEIYNKEGDIFNGLGGAFNGLGDVEHKLGNEHLAEQYYDRVREIYELDISQHTSEEISYAKNSIINAYLGKGQIYIDQKEYEKGIKFYKTANEIGNNIKTLNSLGEGNFRNNDLIPASDFYQQSLDKKENYDALKGLGLIKIKQGNVAEGWELIEKAGQNDKNTIKEMADYGYSLLKNKEYQTASFILKDVILSKDPNNTIALIGLGTLLITEAGEDEEMITEGFEKYERAISNNDKHVNLLVAQAEEFNDKEQYDNGKRLSELILEHYPDNINAKLSLRESSFELKR